MARRQRKRVPRNLIGFTFDAAGSLVAPVDMSHLAPDRPAYQCRDCGIIWPDLCFNSSCIDNDARRPRPTCVVCQQDINDERKRANRWISKARNVLQSHMDKERKQGLHACITLAQYEQLTGITTDWLAKELERIYSQDICPHCFRRYSDMPNGHADLSVDRPDRTRCLNRTTNLAYMCKTGNSQKGTTDPRTYDVRQAAFRYRHPPM